MTFGIVSFVLNAVIAAVIFFTARKALQVRERARRSLDSGFNPRPARNRCQDFRQRRGVHCAGGATAEVNRLRPPLPRVARDLGLQCFQILRFQIARKNARGEIAVSALLGAERVGNVNAGHLVS